MHYSVSSGRGSSSTSRDSYLPNSTEIRVLTIFRLPHNLWFFGKLLTFSATNPFLSSHDEITLLPWNARLFNKNRWLYEIVDFLEMVTSFENVNFSSIHYCCHWNRSVYLNHWSSSATISYGKSMFQRFQEAGHPVQMLKTQYRMHPEVRLNISVRLTREGIILLYSLLFGGSPLWVICFFIKKKFFALNRLEAFHQRNSMPTL